MNFKKIADTRFKQSGLRHCVKSVQMWSYFGSVFSCVQSEYFPVFTSYLGTFHTVCVYIEYVKVLVNPSESIRFYDESDGNF